MNDMNGKGHKHNCYVAALLPAAALGIGLAAPVVHAQGALEEVIVTAQRRDEVLRDVPVSVAVFSPESLASSGVSGTEGLPALVPSVQLVRSGPSAMFYVRGVGNSSAGTGEEGTNAFYVDNVFIADLKQTALKFNNVERVEVLKGPQGTLFGRNSSGGLVNVITREPGRDFEARINVGIANYETHTAQAYLAGPLTDTLSADVALTTTNQQQGWGRDQVTGKDVRLGWDWGVRSKWVWLPDDATRVTLTGEYAKSSDNFSTAFRLAPGSVSTGGIRPPADPYDTNTPDEQFSDMALWGMNLTAEFDLQWAMLTSITGVRENKNHSAFDADTGPLKPAFGMDLARIELRDTATSYQQEFRLASESDGPWSWQTGLFLLYTEAELHPQTSTGLAFASAPLITGGQNSVFSTLETTSAALFGELSYELTDSTLLTAGLRYTRDKLDFNGKQIPLPSPLPNPTAPFSIDDSTTETEPTWRLSIRQDITENINVYASYNRGFKSGTYSMSNIVVAPVRPQTIDAYEVGIKSLLLDSRLRLNLAAFQYEISDYQVRATSGSSPVAILLNAAEVDVNGVEIEFEVAPVEALRLYGSATWLDSEFADFPNAPLTWLSPANCAAGGSTGAPSGGTTTCFGSAAGNDTPLAPRFAGNVGMSYTLLVGASGELELSAMYSYNDGYYFEPDNRLEQPAFSTLNASVAWRPTPHWAVELWGRNLENETYYVSKLATSLADLSAPAAPRTYGVNFKYTY